MTRRRTLIAGLLAGLSVGLACGASGSAGESVPAAPGQIVGTAPCGSGPGLADTPGNLLANGGFENGAAPWYYIENQDNWGGFSISDRRACHGKTSLHFELRKTQSPVMVLGAIQDVEIDRFPDTVSGRFYVENWKRGSPKQYIQLVLIAEPGNRQLRYILGGLDSAPYRTGPRSDARYVIVGPRDPVIGKWVAFERQLRSDFSELWGIDLEPIKRIRCYFEVRYDSVDESAAEIAADVFYDDLYLGPAPASVR